ncbi:MAG: acyl-CoA carboxylase subunit epsilon [Salinibacterium sp.]|nr:acyl-CoA carboxylase subunit epsilon [Salinibacterium sp.]
MSADAAGPEIRVISSSATPEDIAAVTVVVNHALAELADELGAEPGPGVSAWQRSQRALRTPMRPGPGAWRSFSA